jgi:hypothetical protein
MKNKTLNVLAICIAILICSESAINAQINDIKIKSKENKENHSNNNSTRDKSSSSNNDNSECVGGCLNSLFSDMFADLFSGCLNSLSENKSNNNNNQNAYIPYNSDDDPRSELEKNLMQENQNQRIDTFNIQENQNQVPDNINIHENQKINSNETISIVNDTAAKVKTSDISLDINANFAVGYEYSSIKSYTYYNFLPGLRLNLDWFLIDYRYNLLSSFTDNLPDDIKTWDLMFLFRVKANEKTKIIFGTGMHKEQFSDMMFNEHFLGIKSILNKKQDFIDINVRLAIDYKTSEFPFSEIGIHFNKCFVNSKSVSAFFNLGAMYQNYYSSADIWALRAGITLNIH